MAGPATRIGLQLPLIAFLVTFCCGSVSGQPAVGRFVSVQGGLEVRHAGQDQWEPALLGSQLSPGDRIRTSSRGGAKILFQDESVIDLAASTEIQVERIGLEPTANRFYSLIQLFSGKLRAMVGPQYRARQARYEIETPTAVAVSHGGQVIVLHDADQRVTEVVAVDEEVEVRGTLGVVGPGVTVTSGQRSEVPKDRFPGAPEPVDAQTRTRYLRGLEILGTGSDEGVGQGHPAMEARVLRPEDLPRMPGAAIAPSPNEKTAEPRPAPAFETVVERLSPDVGVHRQPIPEFQNVHPGEPPSGGVRVDF